MEASVEWVEVETQECLEEDKDCVEEVRLRAKSRDANWQCWGKLSEEDEFKNSCLLLLDQCTGGRLSKHGPMGGF